jgi:hypothetical protein
MAHRDYHTGPGQKRTPLTPEQIADATERLRRGHRTWREARDQAVNALRAQGSVPRAKFRARHWEVILRHLAGHTQVEIARDLGYSQPVVVRQILKRPEVAALIDEVRAAQLERIMNGEFGPIAMAKAAAPKAMAKHIDLIDRAASEKVQLQAADAVLDRAGYAKTQQVEVHHVHEILRRFTPDELDRYGRTGDYPDRFADIFRALEGPKDPDGRT